MTSHQSSSARGGNSGTTAHDWRLVMHLLRVACGECRNGEMVEEVSVQAAVQLIDYFKSQTVRVHAAMSRKTELPEADRALVEAVEKLVVANGDRWAGNAKTLLEQLGPHAGEAVNLPRWPTSAEAMGHAIRRVAGHLAKDHRIKVTPPCPHGQDTHHLYRQATAQTAQTAHRQRNIFRPNDLRHGRFWAVAKPNRPNRPGGYRESGGSGG